MSQTCKQSLIEATSNTFLGLLVSATANYVVLPLFYDQDRKAYEKEMEIYRNSLQQGGLE